MKKKIILLIMGLFLLSGCTFKLNNDNMENINVYTTIYPIRYLITSLYGDNSTINSIYPSGVDTKDFELSDKKLSEYANSDLFVFNSLDRDRDFAVDMINKNNLRLTLAGQKYINFFNENIKVEYTSDVLGVEICGVVKNIFAISCGILDGMNTSDSTKASFINLVINETANILDSFGCCKDTIFLSCGIGAIILTCTSINSRNYKFGYMIGSNTSKKEIDRYLSTNTVEGLNTLKSFKTNNKLVNLIYDIIYNNVNPQEILNYIVK